MEEITGTKSGGHSSLSLGPSLMGDLADHFIEETDIGNQITHPVRDKKVENLLHEVLATMKDLKKRIESIEKKQDSLEALIRNVEQTIVDRGDIVSSQIARANKIYSSALEIQRERETNDVDHRLYLSKEPPPKRSKVIEAAEEVSFLSDSDED